MEQICSLRGLYILLLYAFCIENAPEYVISKTKRNSPVSFAVPRNLKVNLRLRYECNHAAKTSTIYGYAAGQCAYLVHFQL